MRFLQPSLRYTHPPIMSRAQIGINWELRDKQFSRNANLSHQPLILIDRVGKGPNGKLVAGSHCSIALHRQAASRAASSEL